jgi:hypothetical protein
MPAAPQPISPSAGSASVRIFCVNPKLVDRIWPLAKPLLEPAFHRTTDLTIESVEADVMSAMALLWLACKGAKIIAAATTAIVKTPRHKICIVTCAGGRRSRLWDQFMPIVEKYAGDEGCALVRVMGRDGWARVLSGYEQPWIVLDKRIG